MNELIQDLVKSLLPALIISPITAYLTVRLSLREFMSRWWWEKKAEAYSHIVEQLAYLELYFRALWDDGIGARVLTEEYKKHLITQYGKTRDGLRQVSAAGAFIISEEASIALSEFINELEKWDPRDWLGDLDRWAGAQQEAIAKIRSLAKQDLGI